MKSLLYIFLLLLSPEVFAGLFDPPPTDQSVRMLGMIFGSNIGNIYLGGAPNPIMSQIMEKFNFIIVTVGTVIVAYVGIMSTINTAQEGSAMGKKWSAVWVPMRSIAGMALMIPSPASGYSMIQITVMWIILQGIGAADQIWLIALNGLKSGASAMAGIPPNTADFEAAGKALVPEVLDAAICMEALNEFGKKGTDHINNQDFLYKKGSYIKHFSKTDPISGNTVSGKTYFGVDDPSQNDPTLDWQKSICGSYSVSGTATQNDYGSDPANVKIDAELQKASELIYSTKQLALSAMLTVLKPLAEGIVDRSVKPPAASGNTPSDPAGYKKAAGDAYVAIMSGLIVPVDNLGSGSASTDFRAALKTAEQKGWIVAGSYYFVFNKTLQSKVYENAKSAPSKNSPFPICDATISPAPCITESYNPDNSKPDPERGIGLDKADLTSFRKIPVTNDELRSLSQFLAYGNRFLLNDSYQYQSSLGFSSSMAQNSNAAMGAFMDTSYAMVKSLSALLEGTPGADPLMMHAWFGRDMMILAEALWITLMALTLIMAAALWPASLFTGGGGALMIGFVTTVLGMLLPLLAFIWSMGAMLAVYAPLIPFMIFTTAAIGWLLTVIEAVVAAPLIALGLVTPSGDELGKLETALMILANIFLRPMLMIFGFLLAGRLFAAVVSLVDLGMLEIFKTINVNTMFAWVVMLAAYVSFIISCTNTCFSLIYALPDKILRWLGGPAESTDTSAVQQTKGMTQSAASGTSSGGSAIAGAGAKGVGSKAKDNLEKSRNKEGGGGRPEGVEGPLNKNGGF